MSAISFATDGAVARIELDRPDKANALDAASFTGLSQACERLDADPALRVGVLSGSGRHFCAGIDLQFLAGLQAELAGLAPVEMEDRLVELILGLQRAIAAIERCRKPVIAAVQGACVGGGLELIAACDLRYASAEARFALKEVELAIVADLGVLQRLPALVGEGRARELAFTGREFGAEEAVAMGLLAGQHPDPESLRLAVGALATELAGRSPRTLEGIKATFGPCPRARAVADDLESVARRSARVLLSGDTHEALAAARERRAPRFADRE